MSTIEEATRTRRNAKRDELAAQAMQSLLTGRNWFDLPAEHMQPMATGLAAFSYLIANAMLAAGREYK